MATVSKAQKKLPATAASSNPLNPLMKPWVAKSFYGIAAGYFSYDIGCEVLRKHRDGRDNSDHFATMAHGLTFHALLSLGNVSNDFNFNLTALLQP